MQTEANKNWIVYEVNLKIKKSVYEEHKDWFLDHIKDMVALNDFVKVNVFQQLNLDPTDDSYARYHRLTAQYYLNSYEALDVYLEKMAKNMRSQVMEKFGDHYSVFRRVFELEKSMTKA